MPVAKYSSPTARSSLTNELKAEESAREIQRRHRSRYTQSARGLAAQLADDDGYRCGRRLLGRDALAWNWTAADGQLASAEIRPVRHCGCHLAPRPAVLQPRAGERWPCGQRE